MTATYNPISVSSIEESSAYQGFSTTEPSVFVEDDIPLQDLLYDEEEKPDKIDGTLDIPEDKLTHVVPRHGQNICSNIYVMALLILFKFGGLMPKVVTFANSVFTSVGYATYDVADFYVLSRLQYFHDCITAMASDSNLTASSAAASAMFNTFQSAVDDGSVVISTATTLTAASTGSHYIRPASGTLTIAGAFGGGADSFLFVDGNLNIQQITATGAFNTTIVCTANVTFAGNNTCWSVGTGRLTIVSGNNVVFSTHASSSLSASATGKVVVAHKGTFLYSTSAGIPAPDGANKISYVSSTDTTITVQVTITPTAPTQYAKDSYAPLTGYTDFATNSTMSAGFNANFPGTFVFANMVTTQEDETFAVDFVSKRGICQYAAGMELIQTFKKNDVHEIQFSVRGKNYETFVAFQKSANHSPNFGIHTEPHGFQNYVADMLQTYRISNDRYEAFKGGKYFCMSKTGWIILCDDVDDFELPTLPHYNGLVKVDKACTVSLSTEFPTTMPADAGGMDAYTADGSAFVSKYRRIEASPDIEDESETYKVLHIHAPYKSEVRYAPLHGRTSEDAGFSIIKNPSRHSRIVHKELACTRTKDPDMKMHVRVNAAEGHFEELFTSYVCETFALVLHEEKLHRVEVDSPKLFGEVQYTLSFNATTSIAKIHTVENGNEHTTSITLEDPEEDFTVVHLVIHFGDMIDDTVTFKSAEKEDEEMFVRTIDGLEFHGHQLVASGTGEFFLPGLTAENKRELLEHGVVEVEGKPDYFKRQVMVETPLVEERYIIDGEVVLRHKLGETWVNISVADGIYTNEANASVEVVNGQVLIASLPMIVAHVRFVAKAEVVPAQKSITKAEYIENRNTLKLDEMKLLYRVPSNALLFSHQGGSYTSSLNPAVTGAITLTYKDSDDQFFVLNIA